MLGLNIKQMNNVLNCILCGLLWLEAQDYSNDIHYEHNNFTHTTVTVVSHSTMINVQMFL